MSLTLIIHHLISSHPLVSYTIKIMYCASNIYSYLFSPYPLFVGAVPSRTSDWHYFLWPDARHMVQSALPFKPPDIAFPILVMLVNSLVTIPPFTIVSEPRI